MSEIHHDVLVIGGGVIGLSCAWKLALDGRRICIIDRGELAQESSWAGAGIIETGSFVRTDALAAFRRHSAELYPAFAGELQSATGIDPEYITCGHIELIRDDNQDAASLRECAAASGRTDAAGNPIAVRMTPQETAAFEPLLAGGDFRSATLYRDVAQVRNPRLTAALRRACERLGVTIIESVPVTALHRDDDGITTAKTPRGDFSAIDFVLGAGAWSATIDAEIAKSIPVRPIRGHIVLLRHTPAPSPRIIGCGSRYMVVRRDGHILIGSTEEDVGFDKSTTPEAATDLLGFAHRVAPGLEKTPVVRTWAGLRPATPDGKPFIGPIPGYSNVIAATGHYRAGVTLAPATAEAVAELIRAGSTSADISEFAPGRRAV